jgi:MoaA/NifB/PqqE/SkfB family radical SAM enzyme
MPKTPQQDMTTAEIRARIDDAYELGCVAVIFEGGEPTLRDDLSALVDHARARDMITIVITNGLNDIASIEADAFWISIEGDQPTHDRIRGTSVFEIATSTIARNSSKHIVILTSLSRENVSAIEDVPRLFPDRRVWFNFVYPYCDIIDEALSQEEAREVAAKIKSLKTTHPNIINSAAYLDTVGGESRCHDWWTLMVHSDGREQHGCTVNSTEVPDCSRCNMSCNAEPYHALLLNRGAIACVKELSGLRSVVVGRGRSDAREPELPEEPALEVRR